MLEKNLKIFLPEEIQSYFHREIYIGISLKKKRIIVFSRREHENVCIQNLIFPSVIEEKGNIVIPTDVLRYLGWEDSLSFKIYTESECIIIEPIKESAERRFL